MSQPEARLYVCPYLVVGNEVDLRAEQVVEQEIALHAALGFRPILQNQHWLHAELPRCRSTLPRVVGLCDATARDEHVGLLGVGLTEDELELAGLVSSGRQAGHIFSLDEDARSVQGFRKAWHLLQRRRQERDACLRDLC